jgi:hypothetical protein
MEGELSISFAAAVSILSAVASGSAMWAATIRRTQANAAALEEHAKRLTRLEHWRTAELALENGRAADESR